MLVLSCSVNVDYVVIAQFSRIPELEVHSLTVGKLRAAPLLESPVSGLSRHQQAPWAAQPLVCELRTLRSPGVSMAESSRVPWLISRERCKLFPWTKQDRTHSPRHVYLDHRSRALVVSRDT